MIDKNYKFLNHLQRDSETCNFLKKSEHIKLFFLELNFTELNESLPKSVNSHMAQSASSDKCKRQKMKLVSFRNFLELQPQMPPCDCSSCAFGELYSSSLKIRVTVWLLLGNFLLKESWPSLFKTSGHLNPAVFLLSSGSFFLSRRERNKLRQRSLPGTVAPPLHLLSFWRYSMRHLLWADSMRLLRYVDISFPFLDTLLCFNKRVWAQFKGGGLSLCSGWVKQQRLTFYATPKTRKLTGQFK